MGATNSRASPEPERTDVTLPEENPEIEPLAGASERQGATEFAVLVGDRRRTAACVHCIFPPMTPRP